MSTLSFPGRGRQVRAPGPPKMTTRDAKDRLLEWGLEVEAREAEAKKSFATWGTVAAFVAGFVTLVGAGASKGSFTGRFVRMFMKAAVLAAPMLLKKFGSPEQARTLWNVVAKKKRWPRL